MIVDYVVVDSSSVGKLAVYVNELIKQGYEPYGYMFIDGVIKYQAMVKREGKISL